jgi:hypothetical protein
MAETAKKRIRLKTGAMKELDFTKMPIFKPTGEKSFLWIGRERGTEYVVVGDNLEDGSSQRMDTFRNNELDSADGWSLGIPQEVTKTMYDDKGNSKEFTFWGKGDGAADYKGINSAVKGTNYTFTNKEVQGGEKATRKSNAGGMFGLAEWKDHEVEGSGSQQRGMPTQQDASGSQSKYTASQVSQELGKLGYSPAEAGQFIKQHSQEFQNGDFSALTALTGGTDDYSQDYTPQGEAPPGTSYDESGKMVFNTGNTQLDEFLNNTYLPLLEAELGGGDPNAIFDSEAFAKIKERVDATYGPIFENELRMATETFDLSKEGITAQQEKLTEDTAIGKERTLQDTATQKQRVARSFAEAQEESKLAMAARKLTFGGARKKEERKLKTAEGEQIGDLEKAKNRSLQDLTGQEKFGTGQLGRQMTGLEQGFANTKTELAGEKTLQYGAERERLRTLGGNLLQNPEFMPQ